MRPVLFLSIVFFCVCLGLVVAEPIQDDLPITMRFTDVAGTTEMGPWNLTFNLSRNEACTDVVFSESRLNQSPNITGIVSLYLHNIPLNFTEGLYLCVYQNQTYLNGPYNVTRTSSAFSAKYVNASGILDDADLNLSTHNATFNRVITNRTYSGYIYINHDVANQSVLWFTNYGINRGSWFFDNKTGIYGLGTYGQLGGWAGYGFRINTHLNYTHIYGDLFAQRNVTVNNTLYAPNGSYTYLEGNLSCSNITDATSNLCTLTDTNTITDPNGLYTNSTLPAGGVNYTSITNLTEHAYANLTDIPNTTNVSQVVLELTLRNFSNLITNFTNWTGVRQLLNDSLTDTYGLNASVIDTNTITDPQGLYRNGTNNIYTTDAAQSWAIQYYDPLGMTTYNALWVNIASQEVFTGFLKPYGNNSFALGEPSNEWNSIWGIEVYDNDARVCTAVNGLCNTTNGTQYTSITNFTQHAFANLSNIPNYTNISDIPLELSLRNFSNTITNYTNSTGLNAQLVNYTSVTNLTAGNTIYNLTNGTWHSTPYSNLSGNMLNVTGGLNTTIINATNLTMGGDGAQVVHIETYLNYSCKIEVINFTTRIEYCG